MKDPKATFNEVILKIAGLSKERERISTLETAARTKFEAGALTKDVKMMEDARAELHVLLDQTMDLIVSFQKIKTDAYEDFTK